MCCWKRKGVRKGVRVDSETNKILYCMFCNFGTHEEVPDNKGGNILVRVDARFHVN